MNNGGDEIENMESDSAAPCREGQTLTVFREGLTLTV